MTYSIVARDPQTGAFGVAVQSHWFGVGAIVPWARPGAGAVATQSVAEVGYGPRGLDRLADGAGAEDLVRELVAGDPGAPFRQLGVVDRMGSAHAYTGRSCIPFASHQCGEGFTCQANIMLRDTVPGAMATAYTASLELPFGDRLLAALDAAEGEGGDMRGRQSAALLIVPATGDPWTIDADLRVDDDPDPLAELRRLLVLRRAYALADEGDELTARGKLDEAAAAYAEALEYAPDNAELQFFAGIGAAQAGDVERGIAQIRAAIAANPGLGELARRVPEELAPGAERLRAALGDDPV
jgi:uncharacterized Ntn-hydrolase superfamily protein